MAQLMVPDNLALTKRVRVDPQMAKDLAQDAKQLGLNESEAMRLGFQLLHRLAQRQRHGGRLLDLADIPGDKLKPAFP